MTTPGGIHNYTYDANYQLTNVDYPQGAGFPDMAYNYDSLGNRVTTVNGGTVSYTSNNLNQYTDVGGTALTYDANGNLTNDGEFTFGYDYENRLISATKTGTAATYQYDALGRRRGKTVNGVTEKYLYDGDQIIAEYDGAGTLKAKFVYGTGIDEIISMSGGSETYYYHYDGLGSVTNLTNSSSLTVESYTYAVYGAPSSVSTLGNRYLFTGREYESETGLYHYRARAYSPRLGRFLQVDPIGYFETTSLYKYCGNSSTNYLDPSGLLVEIGSRVAVQWGILKGYHTVIILRPDNPADFENDPQFKDRFYKNANGELEATLSASPDKQLNWNWPFGNLNSTPNHPDDRPENMLSRAKINDQYLKRSDTQLIRDIFNEADKYKNNVPYDPVPVPFTGFYNSNSYVYGILNKVGIKSIPNLLGWEPGARELLPFKNSKDCK